MPLVFLFVFVDILGFSIVLPLFPYWREMFSASPTAVGVLGSANAIAQLIAGNMTRGEGGAKDSYFFKRIEKKFKIPNVNFNF